MALLYTYLFHLFIYLFIYSVVQNKISELAVNMNKAIYGHSL